MKPIDKSKPSNRRCWNCKHFRDARVIEEGPYIESRKFYCEISSHIVRYWSCCPYFEWDPDKQYEQSTLTPPNELLTCEGCDMQGEKVTPCASCIRDPRVCDYYTRRPPEGEDEYE